MIYESIFKLFLCSVIKFLFIMSMRNCLSPNNMKLNIKITSNNIALTQYYEESMTFEKELDLISTRSTSQNDFSILLWAWGTLSLALCLLDEGFYRVANLFKCVSIWSPLWIFGDWLSLSADPASAAYNSSWKLLRV